MKINKTLMTTILFVVLATFVYAGSGTHSTILGVGNANPAVTAVYSVANVDLNAGTTKTVYIAYNVSDNNGYADLNTSEAKVYLTKTGETTRSNTTGNCAVSNNGGLVATYNCSVIMQFYDGAGTWTINVTAKDNTGLSAYNDTTTLTVNALDNILLNASAINCGTLSSPSTNNKCDTLLVTNRGNQNYGYFNETAYDLKQALDGAYIASSSFRVNVTDSSTGTALANATKVKIPSSALVKGAASTLPMYMYVDIASGKPADTYTSIVDWLLEAI